MKIKNKKTISSYPVFDLVCENDNLKNKVLIFAFQALK